MQGRYLPVFASEIVDQNTIAKAEGRDALNLKSVLIGNGVTDISTLSAILPRVRYWGDVNAVPLQNLHRPGRDRVRNSFVGNTFTKHLDLCANETSGTLLSSQRC